MNKLLDKIPKHNQRTSAVLGVSPISDSSKTRYLDLKPEITEERTIELSVSSDLPYLRWFGYEELEHSPEAVDLSRLNDGANVLFNHNRDDYIGIVQKAWLESGKLYNQILFDTHDLAEKIYQSILSGIVRNVSIGYEINEVKLTGKQDDIDVYRVTKWTPLETSIVTVPADASVGVGRQFFNLNHKDKTPNWEDLEKHITNSVIEKVTQELTMAEEIQGTVLEQINETDIRENERERSEAIFAAGHKYNCPELAQKALKDGWSIAELRSQILDTQSSKQEPIAKSISPVDLDNKEARNYSFLKAIGFAAGKLKADQVGLELEVSDHIQSTRMGGKPPEGIYMDQTRLVSYRAPYETGNPAAAGNLIATDLLADRFIEALYNQSAFLSAGVTYLRDLTGNVEIPREETFTTAYWIGEGLPITESEGTFDKISLSPKKLAVLSKVTYEMIHQACEACLDLELLMRSRLIRGMALKLDQAIGFGTGIGEEPLGILSHPEVLNIVLGVNGSALDWNAVINMQAEIDGANAMMDGSFKYIFNSRTKARLMQTLDHSTGSGGWIWQNNNNRGSVAGYEALCSNQIPNNLIKGTATNLTAAFFGDFSKVLLGVWAGLDVMVDPYSESTNAIIKVIAKQMVDIQLTRGEFFCVASDIQNN